MTDTKTLQEIEQEIEKEAIGLGEGRYEKLRAQGEDKTRPGRELLKEFIPPLAEAINTWVQDGISGKPGPQAGLACFLSQFDPTEAAFMTLRMVVAEIGVERGVTIVASTLGKLLEQAAASDAMQKADPKGFKRLRTKLERCPFPGKRHVLVRRALEKAQVKRISWSTSERTRVGRLLIEMACEVTGLCAVETTYDREKTIDVLRGTEEVLKWLDEAANRGRVFAPFCLPMVIPPRRWTNPFNGGYLDRRGFGLRLLNGKRVNRNYLEELKHHAMPMVYDAVNTLQETPWRVNTAVLNVLQQVWDKGSTLGKLPSRDLLPIPQAPWGDGPAPSEDAEKAHKANVGRTWEANGKMISKRRAMVAKLWVADRCKNFERIYFPHAMDWRGRLYPVTSHMTPQADDSGRALIEFAEGVKLGDNGSFWMAVHGANCYGVDKVSFQERVDWIEEHQDDIVASAFDPLVNTWWADAEDPYLFLAFCFEYAGLVSWVVAGNAQEDFVSHLPVSWDGSCNGLQNFSAMLRDPVGGKATNLVPSDTPADIYQAVADVASRRVELDAKNGEVNAVYWLGKVDRKIAKRPTMTLPYGSGRYGFRDQLREELSKRKLENKKPYIEGDEFLCSMYLANVLYESLGEVVVAARHAMDWLKEVSQIAAKGKPPLPVWWTTPSGLPVMQEYKEVIGQRVNLYYNGRRITMQLQVEGDKLDARKQAQGISPNFVHSLDAAHLVRTLTMMRKHGVTSLMMIHDSYGTHAGNAELLHKVLREAFIEQYSENVLEKFREELIKQLPPEEAAKLPPVPPMGNLELDAVRTSEYFFA